MTKLPDKLKELVEVAAEKLELTSDYNGDAISFMWGAEWLYTYLEKHAQDNLIDDWFIGVRLDIATDLIEELRADLMQFQKQDTEQYPFSLYENLRRQLSEAKADLEEAKLIISGKTFSYPEDYEQLKLEIERLKNVSQMRFMPEADRGPSTGPNVSAPLETMAMLDVPAKEASECMDMTRAEADSLRAEVEKLTSELMSCAKDYSVASENHLNEQVRANSLELLAESYRAKLAKAEDVIWQVGNSGDGSEHGNNQYICQEYMKENK